MRRQLGADAVDIDTRASSCHLAFEDPVPLDFLAVESAAADAAYTLIDIELRAVGEVVRADCVSCAGEVSYLELPGTRQRLEFAGEQQPGPIEVFVRVDGWESVHPVLIEVGEASVR